MVWIGPLASVRENGAEPVGGAARSGHQSELLVDVLPPAQIGSGSRDMRTAF